LATIWSTVGVTASCKAFNFSAIAGVAPRFFNPLSNFLIY
jgi:hypothetical protein